MQSSSIQFNLVQFNSTQYIQFNSNHFIQFNSIHSMKFNSIQFHPFQFNSIQFNSIQFNSIHSLHFNSIQIIQFKPTYCQSGSWFESVSVVGIRCSTDGDMAEPNTDSVGFLSSLRKKPWGLPSSPKRFRLRWFLRRAKVVRGGITPRRWRFQAIWGDRLQPSLLRPPQNWRAP